MRFYDVLVNRSVPTEANRGLTSYIRSINDEKVLVAKLLLDLLEKIKESWNECSFEPVGKAEDIMTVRVSMQSLHFFQKSRESLPWS
jgi:hypothetical protein